MEVPGLEIESELQLLAYATTTATQDLSCVFDLHHSSRQRWILNPLSKARIEPATLWFLVRFVNHCTTTGTPIVLFLKTNNQPHKKHDPTLVILFYFSR